MDTFEFDKWEDRRPWNQIKWDAAHLEESFGTSDLTPAWIADMDFKTAPAIREAVIEAAKHGMYGYTKLDAGTIRAYLRWQERRNGWTASEEWLRYTPGVVSAINLLLQSQTKEGDEILIQRPVYYPFTISVELQKRVVVNNPLRLRDGRYEIDFEDFEKKAASPKCRAFILCTPHNPVGRVFTEEELRTLADICLRHDVFVIADEIHSDLIFPGSKHTVFASLGDEIAQNCAICHAPSKTFNLAGMSFSCIMIPDAERRDRFDKFYNRYCRARPTFFAPVAARAAWESGEEWLTACLEYIYQNYLYVADFAQRTWGGRVTVAPLEGTYLAWLDFRQLEPDPKRLEDIMLHRAKVALDEGYVFGPEGAGFERLNLAAPRMFIEKIMCQIADAFQ